MEAIELHDRDLVVGGALLRRMPEVLVLNRGDDRLFHRVLPEVELLGLGRLPAALDDGDDGLFHQLLGWLERWLPQLDRVFDRPEAGCLRRAP